ncbi:MAG TPA: SH3 domain-containing protein [Anaerolineae bacterium]|nr:SH3 domain-containing protein [Anaerolineae bacterium]
MMGNRIAGRRRTPALVLLSLLLLAALLLPAASPAAASTGQSYGVPPYAQALTNVNIRSGPGTQFPVIGRVYAGQIVQVLSRSANGWYQIACQSGGMVTCWITGSSSYVRPVWSLEPWPAPCPGWPSSCTPPTPPPPPPCSGWPSSCTPPVSQVQALRVVNVRSGPGMGFPVVGQLAPWQVVQVTGVSADGYWYRIVCPFYCPSDCWVSSQSWLVRRV